MPGSACRQVHASLHASVRSTISCKIRTLAVSEFEPHGRCVMRTRVVGFEVELSVCMILVGGGGTSDISRHTVVSTRESPGCRAVLSSVKTRIPMSRSFVLDIPRMILLYLSLRSANFCFSGRLVFSISSGIGQFGIFRQELT